HATAPVISKKSGPALPVSSLSMELSAPVVLNEEVPAPPVLLQVTEPPPKWKATVLLSPLTLGEEWEGGGSPRKGTWQLEWSVRERHGGHHHALSSRPISATRLARPPLSGPPRGEPATLA